MEQNIVVYSKQSDEPRVPLTVRLDWLHDGTIRPKLYWTPDGTCYQVLVQYECTPLALLHDRGVGLRFRVRGKIIETPEPDAERMNAEHETYLYLSDSRFSQKNIVDGRYGHAGKEYVTVTLDVFPVGDYELIGFGFREERYRIEKSVAIEPRGSYHAGGVGLWHKVEACRVNAADEADPENSACRLVALYWELNKWFVSIRRG